MAHQPIIQELIFQLQQVLILLQYLVGIITLAEFKGAGGYTITITNNNFSASYCHVSPNFIVNLRRLRL